jgi:eukaryotic-like serine/threonine-protein kinase
MSLQGNFQEVAAQLTMEDAETHASVGQCAEARSEVASGLGLSRDNLTLERASRALALCGSGNEALNLSNELAKQFPDATQTIRVSLPVTAAALAIERGEAARGLERLEPVKAYDRTPSSEFWPTYLRGQAYVQLKDGGAAAGEFQSILDRRGEVPASVLYPLAYLGLARSAMLANNPGKARNAYEAFLALWKDADPDLRPLKDARLEYSQLR